MNKPCVPFPGISSIFSFVEPFLLYSFDASHCLASHCLLEPSSQACLGNPKLGDPILHNYSTGCEHVDSYLESCSCLTSWHLEYELDALLLPCHPFLFSFSSSSSHQLDHHG